MATTKRKTILDKLVTQLEAIDGTGSYNTDIGDRVYLRRQIAFQESELPAINIFDLQDQPGAEQIHTTTNLLRWQLTLNIILMVKPGSIDAENIDNLIADVYVAIGGDDTFGSNVIQTTLLGDRLEIDQDDKLIHAAIVSLVLLYQTNKYAAS